MRWKLNLAAVVVMTMAAGALAQTPPGGGGAGAGGGGAGGRGGRGNPQQFQQRMLDRLKTDLGASDDEWKVLEPKVQKVMDARRETGGFGGLRMGRRGGRGGGGGGFGGGAGNDPNAPPPTAVQQKGQDLQNVLENKDAKPDEIKSALAAYRDARAKAREDLTKAQDDLRGVLTTKQEAVLVMAGMLE